ncbi:expressed protein [Arabidopsis lyrata subsp. lyrata]|uniref:Expressed protein n=1 Tax=Arabidopsis lyrata subsp. lyrata TaxID=81972 RepID=D7MMD1_ARALL|nr:uncharacterized protein LOC9300882 [Arabidopsis lyrata subsp. lyrata]EFH41066.1 expressed protein [Arabidopsis lyrata subsp. lyrata]|eukprot:XP_002864807.1 uncharacterized protein LOC9300882 [Arabidopsis lyrata subsp. lyrata]
MKMSKMLCLRRRFSRRARAAPLVVPVNANPVLVAVAQEQVALPAPLVVPVHANPVLVAVAQEQAALPAPLVVPVHANPDLVAVAQEQAALQAPLVPVHVAPEEAALPGLTVNRNHLIRDLPRPVQRPPVVQVSQPQLSRSARKKLNRGPGTMSLTAAQKRMFGHRKGKKKHRRRKYGHSY